MLIYFVHRATFAFELSLKSFNLTFDDCITTPSLDQFLLLFPQVILPILAIFTSRL